MRVLLLALLLAALPAAALERVHFLIPAGPGGGLDSTARALGAAMAEAKLVERASFENMTGGGGGRAMSHLIETAPRQQDTLMVNSTPLLVRSLQGLFPHTWRDLVPIAGLIAESSVIAVRSDSPFGDFASLRRQLLDSPGALTVGGGSVRGSFDHVALAMMLEPTGIAPRALRYLPYDGGGKAMLALLGGEIDVLSTGLGEVLGYVASGDVRVLAISSSVRNPALPDVPTLTELGFPVEVSNWRGVFAAPGTPEAQIAALSAAVQAATATESWREALARYGWAPQLLEGDAFARYLEQQEAQLARAMRELGFIR
ncbi:MAG: tripartite tricarboxylate transporter substrate-binding protein [Pseudomonadales bacterium]